MPQVVTVILIDDEGKILILKRSKKVRTYKGKWSGVAGYIEENEKPLETAFKEIKEEVDLDAKDIELLKQLNPISFTDFYEGKKYDWEIFSFLFKTKEKSKIKIDWEHSEYRWIAPSQLKNLETVPYFKEIVSKLL